MEEHSTANEVNQAKVQTVTSDVINSDKSIKNNQRVIVKQRNYVLNDVGALKKKLRAENKKHEFAIGKEAKDWSSITVPMKASFFEYVKANFINEISENEDILKVENAERVKATTENQGDAYVEYSMEITFKANKTTHTIKLTAYTTTCQLFLQPIGEKSGPMEELAQRSTPRFFVETFLLPWCTKAISEKKFNENISQKLTMAIREQIRNLDLQKLDLKKA